MMDPKHSSDTWISRRALLAGAAGVVGAAGAAMVKHTPAMADEPGAEGATGQTGSDPTKVPGRPASPMGRRATSERPTRLVANSPGGVSRTPLQDLDGIITPSDLHYERPSRRCSSDRS